MFYALTLFKQLT